MLIYVLVDSQDTRRTLQMSAAEMEELMDGSVIFMCMKDSQKLSAGTPKGVLAFHQNAALGSDNTWDLIAEALLEVRKNSDAPKRLEKPLAVSGGSLRSLPLIPPNPGLN